MIHLHAPPDWNQGNPFVLRSTHETLLSRMREWRRQYRDMAKRHNEALGVIRDLRRALEAAGRAR